jgi:hypothetical protein
MLVKSIVTEIRYQARTVDESSEAGNESGHFIAEGANRKKLRFTFVQKLGI